MTPTIKTPESRTYYVKMKDGTTEKIQADVIQEPSISKLQAVSKNISPSDNKLFYVLFLEDVEVAKYDQEAVEGWRVAEQPIYAINLT